MALQSRSNIANTAVRIFLQSFGADYDEMRGFPKYQRRRDLPRFVEFFGGGCCYCGVDFGPTLPAVEDHLKPVNQTSLGLHAVGNIVPCCAPCNAAKREKDWQAFIKTVAGGEAARRTKRIKRFVAHYKYKPNPRDLDAATKDLYAEAGEVTMALIRTKIKRTREATSK